MWPRLLLFAYTPVPPAIWLNSPPFIRENQCLGYNERLSRINPYATAQT
jgi:hypothetical protein